MMMMMMMMMMNFLSLPLKPDVHTSLSYSIAVYEAGYAV
jgi:hypothetical protein